LADFFAAFFATFFDFLTRFGAAALPPRLAAFLPFFFFEAFLATANSLNEFELNEWDDDPEDAYRVASASIENTEKTSGFRSRL